VVVVLAGHIQEAMGLLEYRVRVLYLTQSPQPVEVVVEVARVLVLLMMVKQAVLVEVVVRILVKVVQEIHPILHLIKEMLVGHSLMEMRLVEVEADIPLQQQTAQAQLVRLEEQEQLMLIEQVLL
jgi:hypothetical protein